jgi:hypothetical protein
MEELRWVVRWYDPDSTKKAHYKQKLYSVLGSLERAYKYGYADNRPLKRVRNTCPSFLGMTAQWEPFDDFTASRAIETAPSAAVDDVWRAVWNRTFPPTEDVLMSSLTLIKATLPLVSDWHSDDAYVPNLRERHSPIFWRYTPFTRLLVEGLSLITWTDVVSRYGKTPISETALSTFLDLLLKAASNVSNWDSRMVIISQFFPAKGTFLTVPRLSNLDIYTALCQATQDEPVTKAQDLGWVFYHQVSLRFVFKKVVRDLTSKVSIAPSLTCQLHGVLQTHQDSSPWAKLLIRLQGVTNVTCYQIASQAPFEALNMMLFTSPSHTDLAPVKLNEEIVCLTENCEATVVTSVRTAFDQLLKEDHSVCIGVLLQNSMANFETHLSARMQKEPWFQIMLC